MFLTKKKKYITINIRKAYRMDEAMKTGQKLLEIRKRTGMNRRQFAEYFDIPYRTVQDWELGNREMPEYLLRLIVYKIRMEKLVDENVKN